MTVCELFILLYGKKRYPLSATGDLYSCVIGLIDKSDRWNSVIVKSVARNPITFERAVFLYCECVFELDTGGVCFCFEKSLSMYLIYVCMINCWIIQFQCTRMYMFQFPTRINMRTGWKWYVIPTCSLYYVILIIYVCYLLRIAPSFHLNFFETLYLLVQKKTCSYIYSSLSFTKFYY